MAVVLVHVGFGNIVALNRLLAIVAPDSGADEASYAKRGRAHADRSMPPAGTRRRPSLLWTMALSCCRP